ncbi:MAG: DUF1292 domain-containing protein [Myxococcota bacterium]
MGTDPEENGDGHVDGFDESEEFDPSDLVTIRDEEGLEIECAIMAVIEHEGEEFALLARLEQLRSEEGDEIEMFIFRYGIDDEGNQLFSFVDEDATYEAVRREFAVLMDQE